MREVGLLRLAMIFEAGCDNRIPRDYGQRSSPLCIPIRMLYTAKSSSSARLSAVY